MSRTSLVTVVAIFVVLAASAAWRLQHPPLEPRQTIWTNGGFSQMERGRYGRARLNFLKVLTRNPSHQLAIANVSFTELLVSPKEKISNQEALEKFQSLVRQHPRSPHLKIIGSILYLRANMPGRSMELLKDAAKQDPAIPNLWYVIAMAKRSLGDHTGAMNALHKTLELGQRDTYYTELGNEYFYAGDWQAAKRNYQQALDLKPQWLAPKIGILRCLVLMDRSADAIEYGEELLVEIRKKSRKVEVWLNRSLIRVIRGTEKYAVEQELSLGELIQFIETEMELARSRAKFRGMRQEQWKTQLGSKVYSILEFEFNHMAL